MHQQPKALAFISFACIFSLNCTRASAGCMREEPSFESALLANVDFHFQGDELARLAPAFNHSTEIAFERSPSKLIYDHSYFLNLQFRTDSTPEISIYGTMDRRTTSDREFVLRTTFDDTPMHHAFRQWLTAQSNSRLTLNVYEKTCLGLFNKKYTLEMSSEDTNNNGLTIHIKPLH